MESKSNQGRDHGETGLQKEDEDLVRLLPDDALSDVLGRLGPRDLAATRCVRKAWRGIVDARRLLLPHLLPHEVGGIFIKFNDLKSLEFFARPTTGPKVPGELDFLPPDEVGSRINHHCNGLVLCDHSVFNPATRRSTPLPPRLPQPTWANRFFFHNEYLVFDPTVSPHFEVFMIPRVYPLKPGDDLYSRIRDELDPAIEQSEWPPSPWILHVFSSKTGQWEERSFIRDGEPTGTVGDMRRVSSSYNKHYYAAYSQGELYVQCEADFVTILSLSNNRYQIIKPPANIKRSIFRELYLGKSENGVYCAFVDGMNKSSRLRVWSIKELCGRKWSLIHRINLGPLLARQNSDQQTNGPWILQDINYHRRSHKDDNSEVVLQENFEWDSDNDNILQDEGSIDTYNGFIDFLGFHPYKEVVFLSESFHRGLAYHLKNSKVQYLGNIYPTNYSDIAGQHQLIRASFPFTPCWMGECPPGT